MQNAAVPALMKDRPPVVPQSGGGNGDGSGGGPAPESSHPLPRQGCGALHHIWHYQREVKAFYMDGRVQLVVACLISANFLCQITQKQIDPAGHHYPDIWSIFDDLFNVIFLLELWVNMYGNLWWPFWREAWNVFDFLVVCIGMCDLFRIKIPDALKMLRMFRAFRVFRLFNRIASLKKIIQSLVRALPGVFHAFLINLLVMCIYAVLAVENFREIAEDCHDESIADDSDNSYWITARGKCYGKDYYGTFFAALYTLFQVLTGESWSEAVVRPALYNYEDSFFNTLGVSFYFVSFILLNAFVLINVVVAVLLDGMNSGEEKEEPATCRSVETVFNAVAVLGDDVASLRAEVRGVKEQVSSLTLDVKKQLTEFVEAMQNVKGNNGNSPTTDPPSPRPRQPPVTVAGL